jgi:hypothetical protein
MLGLTFLDTALVALFGWLLWSDRRNPDIWRMSFAVLVLVFFVHWQLPGVDAWIADRFHDIVRHL